MAVFNIIFNKLNVINILMSIELILLIVNILFLFLSFFFDDVMGQFFSYIILVMAASESALGLALLLNYYRIVGVIDVDYLSILRG